MLKRKANYLFCVGPFSTESMGFHQKETKSKGALVSPALSVNTLEIWTLEALLLELFSFISNYFYFDREKV